jgi:branched-chain amino acid transport system substrate-binding protein
VESFQKTFGEEPDSYAAQAFDAGNLILVQLAAGREDRDDVRDGLLQTRAYPGATGVLTMRSDGNARRRPFLLGVKGRRFVPLD